MDLKILITGAAGQVGKELVDLCKERKLNFIAYTSSELDITDADQVMATVQKDRPTHVINAAAYTAVDKAEEESEKAYAVNEQGPKNLAIACKSVDAKLIHISTDYVFDGEKEGAYTVEDKPNPQSVYGASKLAGEVAIAELLDNYFILRVSWVFGKYGNNFVKTMLRLAETRNEISVVNDQFGAPMPSVSISRYLLSRSTLFDVVGVKHLGSGPRVTWFQFAEEIFKRAFDGGYVCKMPMLKPITSSDFSSKSKRPVNSFMKSDQECLIDWREELLIKDIVEQLD